MLISSFTGSYRRATLRWLESLYNQVQQKSSGLCMPAKFSTVTSEPLNIEHDSDQTLTKDENKSFDFIPETFKQTNFKKGLKVQNEFKVVRMKKTVKYNRNNNPDLFGNLSNKNPIWYSDIKEKPFIDNDRSDDSTLVRNISKDYRLPEVYLQRMKDLVAQKKIKEALGLFVEMRRNFVSSEHPHYTFMIGSCGRVGYTEMAFKLLRQMTDRGFNPTPATLTGLFNACGESPFPEYGLKKALHLKEKIQAKYWAVNKITYQSMIKAFGKCGDIQTAFQVVDEMATAGETIDVGTYSFLLMSCISNKEAGFTHAIEVWRKMKARRCDPNCFSYNLLLRAARDCDVGPDDISCLLLQHWSSYLTRPYGLKTQKNFEHKEFMQIESGNVVDLLSETKEQLQHQKDTLENSGSEHKSKVNVSQEKEVTRTENSTAVANVLSSSLNVLHERPVSGSEVLDICSIKNAGDRLTLIGGVKGFLKDMKKAHIKPNIKTFTLLLECLPPSSEAEEELMSLFDTHCVKPDIGFFNVLIKRRNCRFDYSAAKCVLMLVNKWSLCPDIITYGVLAMSCKTHPQAISFLTDMKKLGFPLNTEIIGALLSCACTACDFNYIHNILQLMEEERVEPNSQMLSRLEATLTNCRKNIIDLEHGKEVANVFKRRGFAIKYKEFCKNYENWLKEVKFDKEQHVWTQYKTDIFETTSVVETCTN